MSAASEASELSEGFPRVKFNAVYKGPIASEFTEEDCTSIRSICRIMAQSLSELEKEGVAPILPDGKVGGNAAVLYKEHLIVSKSAKDPGRLMDIDTEFCVVKNFDYSTWSADYFGHCSEIIPTSDSPLHFSTLNLAKTLGWNEVPQALLHGHALATEEEAEKFGFPISIEETTCSTPEDTEALLELIRKYPYPENRVYIRKGHGFVLLGRDLEDATHTFRKLIVPHLR